ncbi:MAG TPA: bifunctional diaminohydroxyphosphoribosylaminopyrimidine deaminase/5-amino-6-(5-phosphoribosylamino)uracil reductase RibD [Terriglobia bacterium]|nr:bifunctional diaminohydroxyphosphoribosylaminopyrimidine deaminase/5-amino-6-(5-phosphoribosylamino)uracil reductase RibD [Terriglobia bacterium]
MNDVTYIKQALKLGGLGFGLTSPGAMVGAVLVKNGEIVGEGFYTYDGVRHAEIIALEQAGAAARGATVYTSLEPCSHQGRTGPCARALVDAGVVRVVTAMKDPNPEVNGHGLAMLRAAGIEVECGILEEEARRLNEAFITYKTERRPFGILKIAMSLDGKIATRSGESRWITSEESRALVHELRHRADALVTGSGTIIADKPRLTDRSGLPRRRPLLPVVLDRRGRISDFGDAVIFRGSLEDLSAELYGREIQSFLMECGPDLAFNALRGGIIDKIVVFVAPKILGGREIPAISGEGIDKLSEAIPLRDWAVATSGPDLVLTAYVHRNH